MPDGIEENQSYAMRVSDDEDEYIRMMHLPDRKRPVLAIIRATRYAANVHVLASFKNEDAAKAWNDGLEWVHNTVTGMRQRIAALKAENIQLKAALGNLEAALEEEGVELNTVSNYGPWQPPREAHHGDSG